MATNRAIPGCPVALLNLLCFSSASFTTSAPTDSTLGTCIASQYRGTSKAGSESGADHPVDVTNEGALGEADGRRRVKLVRMYDDFSDGGSLRRLGCMATSATTASLKSPSPNGPAGTTVVGDLGAGVAAGGRSASQRTRLASGSSSFGRVRRSASQRTRLEEEAASVLRSGPAVLHGEGVGSSCTATSVFLCSEDVWTSGRDRLEKVGDQKLSGRG